jgi:hypothetical protein
MANQMSVVKIASSATIDHVIMFGLLDSSEESYGLVQYDGVSPIDDAPLVKLTAGVGDTRFSPEMCTGCSVFQYNQILAVLEEYYNIEEW